MGFLRDITHRDGEGSSKKFFYSVAGTTSTVIMLWLAWTLPGEHGMDDWAFIWLMGIYLLTVGGFEVILEMMKLVLQWKNGRETTTTATTTTTTIPAGTP